MHAIAFEDFEQREAPEVRAARLRLAERVEKIMRERQDERIRVTLERANGLDSWMRHNEGVRR